MNDPAVLLGVITFLGYFIAVAIALRTITRPAPSLLVLGFAVFGYFIALGIALLVPVQLSFWTITGIYSFLTLSFLMAFGAIYKSISLRILLDLLRSQGRASTYDAIMSHYVRNESYNTRLEILGTAGFATNIDGKFVLTSKGRMLGIIACAIQKFFNMRTSG
jgi:hypothetical protein